MQIANASESKEQCLVVIVPPMLIWSSVGFPYNLKADNLPTPLNEVGEECCSVHELHVLLSCVVIPLHQATPFSL